MTIETAEAILATIALSVCAFTFWRCSRHDD